MQGISFLQNFVPFNVLEGFGPSDLWALLSLDEVTSDYPRVVPTPIRVTFLGRILAIYLDSWDPLSAPPLRRKGMPKRRLYLPSFTIGKTSLVGGKFILLGVEPLLLEIKCWALP